MIKMANQVLSLWSQRETREVFENHPVVRCQKKYNELVQLFYQCTPDWKGKIELKFDINSYSIAGQAVARKNRTDITIRINPSYLMEHTDEVINDVVGHELAHALCFVLHPTEKGHGFLWKRCAILFGARPERCHTLDIPKDQTQRMSKIRNRNLIG